MLRRDLHTASVGSAQAAAAADRYRYREVYHCVTQQQLKQVIG